MSLKRISEHMIDQAFVQKVNDHTTQLAEKATKNTVNDIAIDIKSLGVVGNGVTSDAQNFLNALSGLPTGTHILIPRGVTVLIDQDITITGISNLKVTCIGKIKVSPYKKLTFNCPNIKVEGNFFGNYIPSTTITALDSATKSITLTNATEFTVGDNVTSFKNNYYKNIAHVGKILTKSGNTITVDVNGIISSTSFDNLYVGQTIYETGKIGVVCFDQCHNAEVNGYFETGIQFLNCNYPKVGNVTAKYAQVVFDFCYKPSVEVLNSSDSNFYGLFFKGCRGQKTGKVNINRPYFSGLVMKSAWESDLGVTHIVNAPIQSLQIVPNTISEAASPYSVNPLLQDELYNRRNSLGRVYVEKSNLGVVLTQETFNTTIDVIEGYDNYGNVLVTTNTSGDGLKLGSLIIDKHNVEVPTTFTTEYPFLIEHIKDVAIDFIKIKNSRSGAFGRILGENFKIGRIVSDDCIGHFEISTSSNYEIGALISRNQVSAIDILQLSGTQKAGRIKKVSIDIISTNTTANRYIYTLGTLDDIIIEEVNLSSGLTLQRGIYATHSGNGFKILKSTIKNASNGVVTAGAFTGLTIRDCEFTACGNPANLGSTLGERVRIEGNSFYANTSNTVTDNTTLTNKVISNNFVS
ncbi:hypothetical protein [Metabacillus sp. Hm71]|uniref:hypothetical protein n=1 Tax=Metabacillus sp. Hm71 TaxID=3450743 RepID=UPI003F43470E